uniref:EF-hand domain-containing protein n=1 Tax=Leersia perrieri TaxID=77586 RepID=A0A0D9W8Z8_9ORYZ
MAQFFGRLWDRAQGKLYVVRICENVFDELADKNKLLLDINSIHVATLMVYNSINKQLAGPHKDPPCMNDVAKIVERYKKEEGKAEGITLDEFKSLIMEWVHKDLRLVLANKAAVAIMAAPLLAVTAKNAGRKVPRVGDAVEKVPTPLLFTVFSIGLMFLQDIRAGKRLKEIFP